MKKTLCILVAAICLVACMCGCDNTPTILKTAMSEGDFIYNLNDDGSDTAVILGFTEEGLQKEVLIVPETIGGYPVRNYNIDLAFTPLGDMKHDNLKRIYFPYEIKIGQFAFQNNPKLEKIILLFSYNKRINGKTVLFGNINGVDNPTFTNVANVSFYSDNQFYWADDYDYGTKILYQPPEPVRSDAIFAGWYKEPECINPWDFDVDTLPESIIEKGYPFKYQETILYGKWKESNE